MGILGFIQRLSRSSVFDFDETPSVGSHNAIYHTFSILSGPYLLSFSHKIDANMWERTSPL